MHAHLSVAMGNRHSYYEWLEQLSSGDTLGSKIFESTTKNGFNVISFVPGEFESWR